LQLDQLVCPPSIALQSTTEYPNAAKPNLIYLHLYDYICCLNAFTRYIVPIAIANAIGSPKSHRHLMPLVRDLIEPDIKRKR
jgi:hypothetical protein